MKTQMPFNNEIEKTKKEIEVLTAKLALLEELLQTKSPAEEAFKKVYNRYPMTDVNDTCWDGSTWIDFKFGYNAAQEDYKVGEYQPTPQKDKVSLFNRLTPKNGWLNTPLGICKIVRGFLMDEGVIEYEDEEYITIKMQKSLLDAPTICYHDDPENLPYFVGN